MKLSDALARSRVNTGRFKIDDKKILIVSINCHGKRIYKIKNTPKNITIFSESDGWIAIDDALG